MSFHYPKALGVRKNRCYVTSNHDMALWREKEGAEVIAVGEKEEMKSDYGNVM